MGLSLVLCMSACTFLDDLDRSIERKAQQLTSNVTPSEEPPKTAPGDPLSAPSVPTPPSAPTPPAPEPVAPQPTPAAPKSAFDSSLPPAQLAIGTVDVRGALLAKEVARIMERHRNELRFCYEASLTDSVLTKLSLKFVVSPTGAVQVAAIEQSNSGNERLDQCIAQATRRWTFPPPKGGGIAVVTVPIELSRPARKP